MDGTSTDVDLDPELLSRFSCMATTDRDVLVGELYTLLGAQLSREGCEFFLEIGNWNLQAAVGAYYDFYGPVTVPAISAEDVNLRAGEMVPRNVPLIKTWKVKNSGTEVWPVGTSLTLQSRNTLGGPSRVLLPRLRPGEEAEVSVRLVSPSDPGVCQSLWTLSTPTGGVCGGQALWVVLRVSAQDGEEEGEEEDREMTDLTNQLASFSTSENVGSSPPPPSPVDLEPTPLPLNSHSAVLYPFTPPHITSHHSHIPPHDSHISPHQPNSLPSLDLIGDMEQQSSPPPPSSSHHH